MSVRSFHSVFMASAVAGAALGCYLISLRVASERAALEAVEARIVQAQRDIRVLETEIGTRARLAQLERWNVRVLSLSAPTADQILGDKFQLASLVAPQRKPAMEAPVVLASAPATPQQQAISEDRVKGSGAPAAQLLHEAGLQSSPKKPAPTVTAAAPARPAERTPVPANPGSEAKKVGDKRAGGPTPPVTGAVRTAKVDPLAPVPAEEPTAKGSRTER